MKRTYQELIGLALRLGATPEFVGAAGLPTALKSLACDCFLNQRAESEDTRLLRHQVKYLNEQGYFDLTPEPCLTPGT